MMNGNGIANIVAAAILAFAIIYTGGFGGRDKSDADVLAQAQQREIVVRCAEGDKTAMVLPNVQDESKPAVQESDKSF